MVAVRYASVDEPVRAAGGSRLVVTGGNQRGISAGGEPVRPRPVGKSAGGPAILRSPIATQLAALSQLAVAVTAVVFIAWYAAMKRLGVDRIGLFNGLIPIASVTAVALVGTGTITPLTWPSFTRMFAGCRSPCSHTGGPS